MSSVIETLSRIGKALNLTSTNVCARSLSLCPSLFLSLSPSTLSHTQTRTHISLSVFYQYAPSNLEHNETKTFAG